MKKLLTSGKKHSKYSELCKNIGLLLFAFLLGHSVTRAQGYPSKHIITYKSGSSLKGEFRKHLLLDSTIITNKVNARLQVGSVQKFQGNPLFEEYKIWEPRYDYMYPNVLYYKEDNTFKC